MRSDRFLIVVHQKHSTPGRVGELLESRGYRLDRRCPCLGDELPTDLRDYAGVAVFGGPMSANDCQTLDGIKAEIEFTKDVLDADLPYLGLCLGGQILARALGGEVAPHPDQHVEIGYTKVVPTEAAERDGLFDHADHFFQWHREGFTVPDGAELLATGTNSFPNQAYRYGDKAYGLQFHPEITLDMIHRWNMGGGHRMHYPGGQPKRAHLKGWELFNDDIERWTLALFDRLGLYPVRMMDAAAE